MLGLIKKDFLLIKANAKSMAIVFIIYLVMAFQGTFDVTFILCSNIAKWKKKCS